ncbi:MAG: hypothetical protein QXR45_07430 [Candidatus Bathyarchaeia archaeon]
MKLKIITVTLIILLFSPFMLLQNFVSLSESPIFPGDFPYLFVYPHTIIANPGQNITVSICIFNLSANVFRTFMGDWQSPFDPYPTYNPDGTHVYPLGFLLGFDINFTWDPNILEYLNHELTVPIESYQEPIPPMNYSGTLYAPVDVVKNEVDKVKGIIRAVVSHRGQKVFNGNGTIIKATFRIKREGGTELKISGAKLATNYLLIRLLYPQFRDVNKNVIIFRVGNGFVTTPGARARIYGLDIKAAVDTRRFAPPIVKGENVSVRVIVKNDGNLENVYNLTVFHKSFEGAMQKILERTNVTIEAFQSIVEEAFISTENLNIGTHVFTANLTVVHHGETFYESLSKEIKVVSGEVDIQIHWQPQTIHINKNVTFTATVNFAESGITIKNVTWEIYEHGLYGGLALRNKLDGQTVTYQFNFAKNWTVVVIVTDSLGLTWDQYRPATSNYKKEITIQVLEAIEEAGFPWDLVILAAIVIIVIILAAIYLLRKRR